MSGSLTTAAPLPARFKAWIDERFPLDNAPAFFAEQSLDFKGRPAGWGKAQVEDYEEHRYHQPSDEFDPTWDFAGGVDDMRVLAQLGWRIAQQPAMPTYNAGDQFAEVRKK